MKHFVALIVFVFATDLVNSKTIFHRGRFHDQFGLLGLPRNDNLIKKTIEPKWFIQTLDHFNPADNRIWKQRYFVNDQYYKPGGPVLLQLGGEGTADPIWLQMGQIATNYGKRFHGLLILLEHRYYGKSYPTENMSTENLKYLTSEQSLSDAALFVESFKQNKLYNIDLKTKWIVFGGSYSGSLSAWMRYKYPHLIDAAVASSAPLKALVNFQDYLAVVRDSLGEKCDTAFKLAMNQIGILLKHPLGWRSLNKKFLLCDDFDGKIEEDLANFVSSLVGNIEGVVQYNKDNREFEGALGSNITIDDICQLMEKEDDLAEIDKFANVNKLLLNAFGEPCLDYKYDKFINSLRLTDWNSSAAEGGRQWTYQTCVEFGFFQSSDEKDQPFGHYFPVSFFEKMCKDIYGEEFTVNLLSNGIRFTNTNYGSLNVTFSKVILPNGSIDPWHALGLTNYSTIDSKSVFINGTAHCADLYPDSENDPPQLKAAREEIFNFIDSILKDKF